MCLIVYLCQKINIYNEKELFRLIFFRIKSKTNSPTFKLSCAQVTLLLHEISHLDCGSREVRRVLSCVGGGVSALPAGELSGGAVSALLLALRPLLAAGAGRVDELDAALSAVAGKIPAR